MAETLLFQEAEISEALFERGWTDGLPVVAPTPERVDAMLNATTVGRGEILGAVPQRLRDVSVEKLAINAVMAGCKPEYFPVVLAGMAAVLDSAFNANSVIVSTGGAALCMIVSGPYAGTIGMNSGHGVLGPGSRANATIGRALRLTVANVLGAKGAMDATSIGNPGKYSLCFAEADPPPPWQPLRVDLGYDIHDTTVTVAPTEGPQQVANHLNNGDPEAIASTLSAAMRVPSAFSVGKGGQGVVVLGPEHAAAFVRGGWSRERLRTVLWDRSRVTPAELETAGVRVIRGGQHDMSPDDDGKLPSVATPEDIFLVTAGGPGPGWSAYLRAWAPIIHARAVTRRVNAYLREP
jgi:hypothetical protein